MLFALMRCFLPSRDVLCPHAMYFWPHAMLFALMRCFLPSGVVFLPSCNVFRPHAMFWTEISVKMTQNIIENVSYDKISYAIFFQYKLNLIILLVSCDLIKQNRTQKQHRITYHINISPCYFRKWSSTQAVPMFHHNLD